MVGIDVPELGAVIASDELLAVNVDPRPALDEGSVPLFRFALVLVTESTE